MHSAIYFGRVKHQRYLPKAHAFSYRVCLLWLDLSELPTVFRGRWFWSVGRRNLAWFRRADYLGDERVALAEEVRRRVESRTGKRPNGPIRMLTQLRMFGVCFNPVTFYYCYNADGSAVEYVLAEITNTPWNERHHYVLEASATPQRAATIKASFPKSFHVSPFMPMEMQYDWAFGEPGEELLVHMTNQMGNRRHFDAGLRLRRRELSTGSLASALVYSSLQGAGVLFHIYWQALRLWLKRTPVFAHR